MSSSLESNSEGVKYVDKAITFDPITGLKKRPLAYNANSARLLSSPAYFTEICTKNPFDLKSVSTEIDRVSAKVNGICETIISDDDDDVVILEENSMPSQDNSVLSSKVCVADNQLVKSEDSSDKPQELQFTIFSVHSLRDCQSPTKMNDTDMDPGGGIPFLSSNNSSSKDVSFSAPEPFDGLASVENNATWSVNDPDGDNLYSKSDVLGPLNFQSFLSQHLVAHKSSAQIDSSLVCKKEKEFDVIEITDSEDELQECKPAKTIIAASHSLSARTDRIMPQLIPLLETSESQQDINNNNNVSNSPSPVVFNQPSFEVIDIPSSPEMPRLIPFTSETEEPVKSKMQNAESGVDGPLNNIGDKFQPQVVLKKLPMDCYKNKASSGCSEEMDDSSCPASDPDIDLIDGLNFYSFLSKFDMQVYCEKFSDFMPFRVGGDQSKDNVIIPTKTNDITLIKGWRTKQFANEDFSFDEDLALPIKYKMEEDNQDLKLTGVDSSLLGTVDKKEPIEGCSNLKNESKSDMSAFLSDALDTYLRNESELKIPLLQKYNPNVIPIPRNAPILSISILEKFEKKRSHRTPEKLFPQAFDSMKTRKRKLAEESPSLDMSASSEVPTPSFKIRKKSAGKVASDRVLKKSKRIIQDSPVTHRLVLRLRKDSPKLPNTYKIAKTEIPEQISKPTKQKIFKSPAIVKESDFILMKETLFSDNREQAESDLLNDFLKNLNRFGTKIYHTIEDSKKARFEPKVITQTFATSSVQSLMSITDIIGIERRKPRRGRRSAALRSIYEEMKKRSSTRARRGRRRTGAEVLLNDLRMSEKQDVVSPLDSSPSKLGKRSIRIPARFLDSAIPSSRSEWVTPNVTFESKSEKKLPLESEAGGEAVSQTRVINQIIALSENSENCEAPSNQILKPQIKQEHNSRVQQLRPPLNIDKKKVLPSKKKRPKRILHSPNCMCRNTTRVMPYSPADKRLVCNCIDSIITAIKTSEGLTDLNEGKEHNYAFMTETKTPTGTISEKSTLPSTVEVQSCKNADTIAIDKPKVINSDNVIKLTNTTKESIAPIKNLAIPGTNRIVSFVLVPTNSPKIPPTSIGQSPSLNSISPSKINPSAPSYNKNIIRLSPPPVIIKTNAVENNLVSNVVANNAIGRLALNPSGVSTNLTVKSNPEATKENAVLPLNSKPLVFSLAKHGRLPNIQGRKLTSIAVKKDHIFFDLPRNSNPVQNIITVSSSTEAVSNNLQGIQSLHPVKDSQNSTVVSEVSKSLQTLPSIELENLDTPVNSAEAVSNVSQPIHIQLPQTIKLEDLNSNRNTNSLNSQTTQSSLACTEVIANSKSQSKSPQSLRAVKLGNRFVLCSSLSSTSTCGSNDTVTLYPATDDSALPDANVQITPTVMAIPPVTPQAVALSASVSAQLLVKELSEDQKDSGMSLVTEKEISSTKNLLHKSNPTESSDEIDVVGEIGIELKPLASATSTPSISSLDVSESDSSSSDDDEEEVEEEESSSKSRIRDKNNHNGKQALNRKKLMERARRSEIRKQLNYLRNSAPELKDKTNLAEVINAAVGVVNHYTTQNFTLSMQVKVLLMRRHALVAQYKKDYMRVKSNRDIMREVLTSLSRPKFKFRKLPTFSDMKSKLMNKLSATEGKESASTSLSTDCIPGTSSQNSSVLLTENSSSQPSTSNRAEQTPTQISSSGTVPKYNSLLDKMETKWNKFSSARPKIPNRTETNFGEVSDYSFTSDEQSFRSGNLTSSPNASRRNVSNELCEDEIKSLDSSSSSKSKWYSSFGVVCKNDSQTNDPAKLSHPEEEEEEEELVEEEESEELDSLVIDESSKNSS